MSAYMRKKKIRKEREYYRSLKHHQRSLAEARARGGRVNNHERQIISLMLMWCLNTRISIIENREMW